jgi:membrane protease YdiL (CAAX protease family)
VAVVASARCIATARGRGATRSLALIVGIGAALGLRVAVGGEATAASMPAGMVFAGALLAVAAAAGRRVGRPTPRAVLLGAGGGALLVGVWLSARPGVALTLATPNAAIALWSPVVAIIAIAEEVVLRGALFTAVRDWQGDGAALVASTLVFALIHLPLYGVGALPLDLAVGTLLGGLRLVSGGVLAPALAHVIADLAGGWLL